MFTPSGSCFPTEADAVAAAARNTGTILPYLNSPSNIYGCFEVLTDMLGKDAARDVCTKNPSILQCKCARRGSIRRLAECLLLTV